MNIPDDAFYGLVTQGMRQRTDETLQRALYHTLRHAILQGTLAANCRLPGSRVMAGRLQLSRNTVNAALEQLALEGYLMRSRQGTQVVPLAACREEPVKVPPVTAKSLPPRFGAPTIATSPDVTLRPAGAPGHVPTPPPPPSRRSTPAPLLMMQAVARPSRLPVVTVIVPSTCRVSVEVFDT